MKVQPINKVLYPFGFIQEKGMKKGACHGRLYSIF